MDVPKLLFAVAMFLAGWTVNLLYTIPHQNREAEEWRAELNTERLRRVFAEGQAAELSSTNHRYALEIDRLRRQWMGSRDPAAWPATDLKAGDLIPPAGVPIPAAMP